MTHIPRLAAGLATLTLLAGCQTATAEDRYARAVARTIPDDTTAIMLGEGACELAELGQTQEEITAALRQISVRNGNVIRPPLDPQQAQLVLDAAAEYLCPDDL